MSRSVDDARLLAARRLRDLPVARRALITALERRRYPRAIVSLIASVPRQAFLPTWHWQQAWTDRDVVSLGLRVPSPVRVATALVALAVDDRSRVLEIGTGSGYCMALFAALAEEVNSVERVPERVHHAAASCAHLGLTNVRQRCDDGSGGWPARAPYDAIFVDVGFPTAPGSVMQQLSTRGGRLVVPIGDPAGGQRLVRVCRHGESFTYSDLGQSAVEMAEAGVPPSVRNYVFGHSTQ